MSPSQPSDRPKNGWMEVTKICKIQIKSSSSVEFNSETLKRDFQSKFAFFSSQAFRLFQIKRIFCQNVNVIFCVLVSSCLPHLRRKKLSSKLDAFREDKNRLFTYNANDEHWLLRKTQTNSVLCCSQARSTTFQCCCCSMQFQLVNSRCK